MTTPNFTISNLLTFDTLSASRLLSTDSNKRVVSISNLGNWVAGTLNQINIGNDGDGSIRVMMIIMRLNGLYKTNIIILSNYY